MLWNRSLVMYDRETGSLWSHLIGEAMEGHLAGNKLDQIPSVMTDWRTWSTTRPRSTALWISRTSSEYRNQFYRRPARFVLGIGDHGRPKCWGFDALLQKPVMHDVLNGRPVLLTFDERSSTARLYGREIDGMVLRFKLEGGRLIDTHTRTVWEPSTGRGVAGTLAGRHLRALPAIISYRKAWLRFHPNSQFVSAKRPGSLGR